LEQPVVASAQVQDEVLTTTTAVPTTQKEKTEAPPSSSSHSVSSNYVPEFKTLSTIHLRVLDLEKEVKELKNVDHSTTLLATIKSEVPTAIKEYLGTSLGDTLHKISAKIKMEHVAKQKESQYTIKSSNKVALNEFDHKQALFETMIESKSFNKHPKHMTLYHALKESILADEDAMDQGVANLDKQKKRKPTNDDREEDPPVGSDQRLKKRKTSDDA
ncbi:hypothetical protein Tco_1326846, partial [Tanacetum coccineum]